jgi:hypothetical protein
METHMWNKTLDMQNPPAMEKATHSNRKLVYTWKQGRQADYGNDIPWGTSLGCDIAETCFLIN